MKTPLQTDLPIKAGCVAFIGAGGKTTTMLGIAQALSTQGRRIVITTTTKIWPPAGTPLVTTVDESGFLSAIKIVLAKSPIATLGQSLGDRGKLLGLEPREVCNLVSSGVADLVACEADGAAGKSLKWHKAGEPVIPSCTTQVVSVAGLDVLGLPVSEVHHPELFASHVGVDQAHSVGPMDVAKALKATEVYVPRGADLMYVLNKADDEKALTEALDVTASLRQLGASETVFCSSRGNVIRVLPAAVPANGART